MRVRMTSRGLEGSTPPEAQGTSPTAGHLVSQAAGPSLQEPATLLWASCVPPFLELTSHGASSMSLHEAG